ncbi:MAG: xylose isomerase [Lachnospiraceae bacterium]|nr:xylose isomerase [Lachnospiraceae bacterium]
MSDYFKNVPVVKYEGPKSKNPFAFKYYDPDRVVAGKTMRDQLKFGMAWWHTLCANGQDMFGSSTMDKSFGNKESMELAKAKVDAGFEFMEKLGIDYYCFHDRDLAPEGRNIDESTENLNAIVDILKEKQKNTGKKLLWGTANLFNNPRYMHGAGTAPNADAFAYAGAQLKGALEATKALDGAGYTCWGGREGYETLLNTDMGLELDNMARLFKMLIAHADKIGFTGPFYIEPKPKEPTKHQYDFDAATCVNFLRAYGLMDRFRLNIETNHATLAAHTMQHELRVARVNGVFGSVDANQGDTLLGWDTDQFPTDVYGSGLAMYEILKAGGFTTGGLNFDSKQRRGSFTLEDTALAHIAGMDGFALGLLLADKMIEDGRIDKFVEERYASWKTGIGKSIIDGKESLDSLYAYVQKMGDVTTNISGRQEELESIMNQCLMSIDF